MINFHVEDLHSFHVGNGGRGLQVHHECGTTTVYRVESPGNQRIDIDPSGNVSMRGSKMPFLNFGDEVRANRFLAQRIPQFPETVIKVFDIESTHVASLFARAAPEAAARGASVIQVDPSKTPLSLGVRSADFPELLNKIVPGSGRIIG